MGAAPSVVGGIMMMVVLYYAGNGTYWAPSYSDYLAGHRHQDPSVCAHRCLRSCWASASSLLSFILMFITWPIYKRFF